MLNNPIGGGVLKAKPKALMAPKFKLAVAGGGGGSWSPSSLANKLLWLDASDSNTITHSSNKVSQWDDKSGNNNNLVQATSSKQPTTNVDTINSKNVITMDIGDLMNLNDALIASTANKCTILFAGQGVNDQSGWRGILSLGIGTSWGAGGIGIIAKSSNASSDYAFMVDHYTANIVTIPRAQIFDHFNFVCRFDNTLAADLQAWNKGSSLGTDTYSGDVGQETNKTTLNTTGDHAPYAAQKVKFCELVVLNDGISDEDRASWDSYVSTKWGIS